MTMSSMKIAFFDGSSLLAVELMHNGARGSEMLNGNFSVQYIVKISLPALTLPSLIVMMIVRMQFSNMIVVI